MASVSPKNWQAYKLHDLGSVGRGKSRHRPRNDKVLYGGKYPFFQTGDVKAAHYKLRNYSQTYNETGLAQSKLWQPGTLLITIAANIADTAILDIQGCFPDSIVGFVADDHKADVRFVKYSIDTLKLQMRNISRGTTQDNLSVDKLLIFDIFAPAVSEQRKIADILSSYDELIENNSIRIEKLETMALLLYRHSLTEGATETELSEITSLITRGISPKYDENGISFVINQRCIRDHKIDLTLARRQSKKIPTSKFVRDGDVLINSTGVGTLGRVAQVFGNFYETTVDSHVSIVRPNDSVNPYYFGAVLMSLQEEFERLGTGATGQTELGRDAIGRVTIPLPKRDTQEEVGNKIQAIRGLVDNLKKRNLKLAHARDLLLPRLMSGEIKV